MRVLVACEESQEVCKVFRELGHEAFSCDILPCSGGHPEWHIQEDVIKVLETGRCIGEKRNIFYINDWDLMIAHPPCTYLTHAGARWLYQNKKLNKERYGKGLQGKEFFMKLMSANIPRIAIENPRPSKIYEMPKESQIIQPCQFGHKLKKTTFLWLKNLPNLKPTNIVEPEYYIDKKGIRHSALTGWSAKRKSKTFSGIAKAMAEQWGNLDVNAVTGETEGKD